MFKYFDRAFFRFFFGFVAILAISFIVMIVTVQWGGDPQTAATAESSQ